MIKKIVFLILFAVLSVQEMKAQTLRIATYNLRYDNPGDSLDAWKYRLPIIKDLISFHDFDLFGTQEGLYHQLQNLKAALNNYEYIGAGRDDGNQKGEHSAIFYNKEKYNLLNKGNFWLSETPQKATKGWDADIVRICTWGQFKESGTGFEFFVFNVHFDHRGVKARKESVALVIKKIKEIAGISPVILTGDFNFDQYDENYNALANSSFLKDAYETSSVKYTPNGTFNGFDINSKSPGRIDHIFLTSHFQVKKYGILTDSYNGRFPSDHFPVVVDLAFVFNKR